MSSLRQITTTREMRSVMRDLQRAGKTTGLAPTMGALHEGHLSLVKRAKEECDVAIATIFVNPTQFAPHEDFAKYPRPLEDDLKLLASVACDYVFVPTQDEMYPADATTFVDPPAIAEPLEGVCRPGHFRGVTTIVLKLFNIIPAENAYFGQKDYQQQLVIRKMASDLNVPTKIVTCAIVREPDGLALSSRNRYLSSPERLQALSLSRALRQAQESVTRGERNASALIEQMRTALLEAGIQRIDYATIAHPESLATIRTIRGTAVALIAAFVGSTRLIDNCLLSTSEASDH